VRARKVLPRVLVGVGVVCVVALVLVLTGWEASLWGVFSGRERVQQAIDGAGAFAPLVYLALLVFQAVIAPLPAPAVAIAGGYTFGVVEGFLLTWVGSLAGGVISFGISRFFGRGFVKGRGMTGRLDRYVEEHGVVLIFVLRLIPLVSFDALSYAAGLSGIRFRGFRGDRARDAARHVRVRLFRRGPGWLREVGDPGGPGRPRGPGLPLPEALLRAAPPGPLAGRGGRLRDAPISCLPRGTL